MDEDYQKHRKWAIPPFRRSLDYLSEIDRILHLSVRGISGLRGAFKLEQALLAYDLSKEERDKTISDEERLQRAKQLTALAETEIQNDFPLLHAHALVAHWGALEALIDDLLVTWLLNEPKALEVESVAKIRIPLANYETLEKADRMAFLIDELKRQTESRYRPGIASLEELLGVFGLSGPLDDQLKRTLLEFREVRNILVHNAGVVDRRFLGRCPWTKWTIGEKIQVTHAQYKTYTHALHDYIMSLIDRIKIRSGLPPTAPEPSGEET